MLVKFPQEEGLQPTLVSRLAPLTASKNEKAARESKPNVAATFVNMLNLISQKRKKKDEKMINVNPPNHLPKGSLKFDCNGSL